MWKGGEAWLLAVGRYEYLLLPINRMSQETKDVVEHNIGGRIGSAGK
jgi:hypothetical protein